MISACRKHCLETVELTEKLIDIAKNAYSDCDDDHCLVLFGTVLDTASKMRRETQKRIVEMEKRKGILSFSAEP